MYLRLLPDIQNLRGQQTDEVGNGTGIDDDLCVIRGARSDICIVSAKSQRRGLW